ncbi:MAG: cation-translocating P-type ATPase [Acidobacteria bacterium]|nr:cation-translocating P-type ATPase [Acidobacteriota bacterium]
MSAAAAPVVCTKCVLHAESVFRVAGMDCAEEALILERRLTPLAGVEALNVDVLGQKMRVSYDAAVVSAAAIADAVAETGMKAWLEHERPVDTPSADAATWPLAVSGAAVALGLGVQYVAADPRWAWPLFAVAVVLAGRQPARRGVASLMRRVLDIHVLMLVAVTGALVLGDWAEAATVIWLFAMSQWLEVRTMERARRAIRGVMTLAPTEARVKHGDHEHVTAGDLVLPGATIVVAPGQKIPLDGVVVAGTSDVNQAPITGESLPVPRGAGDDVFAGTINGQGALDVRVTRAVRDTALARIVHLVEAAQAQRAPSQQFIDRFARWYTPAVVLAALAVFLVPVVAGGSAAEWGYRALVLLVVACPCALVISTPVSIVAALATAARHGVLIKGGAHLERLAGVRVVAFDKTGTLTSGEPEVRSVVPLGGARDDDALAAAAAVEQRSAHPIAGAIVNAARARGVLAGTADDVRDLPGRGAEGRWRGRHVLVGNAALMTDRGVSIDAAGLAESLGARGETAVYVAIDGVAGLALGVADRPRAVAADVVRLLRGHGVTHVALLTGDTAASAAALARATGLTDVRAGLLPAEKLTAVHALRAAHGPVAMVGDGVNDAPALAAADVGIAMGAAGSAAALEAADVALMSDELQKLPYAIRLSRATLANVRVNIAIALGLKVAVLGLAVFGLSTLWMAVVADSGASVLVVANAMRLLRHR